MMGKSLELVIPTICVMLLMGVVFTALYTLGDSDRAFQATFQALRWFLAGGVIASMNNILTNEPTFATMIPGSVAILSLMGAEYIFRGIESRYEQSQGRSTHFA